MSPESVEGPVVRTALSEHIMSELVALPSAWWWGMGVTSLLAVFMIFGLWWFERRT